MKKEDSLRSGIEYIERNTALMQKCIEQALKEGKISEMYFDTLKWHLERIDYTSNNIKELAD